MPTPIGLAVVGYAYRKFKRSRGRTKLFWTLALGLVTVMSFGGFGPLMAEAVRQFPGLGKLGQVIQEKGGPAVPSVAGGPGGPVRVYFTTPGGVRVRLVTDTDYVTEAGPTALRAAGVPVVDDRRDALMHNKFMVFDDAAVWTGSMNFTENCAYRNDNHGLYFASPELAAVYAARFRRMFEQRDFGPPSGWSFGRADVPSGAVTLADGTTVEVTFSPGGKAAQKVTNVVAEATRSVHFLAFSFTHAGIAQAMLDKARAGVEVRGVFETSQAKSGYSQFGKLAAARLPVFADANPRNMHHKLIVVDGRTVVAGSFNFSDNADTQNNENVLVIRNNAAVAERFEGEFRRVADLAEKAPR